jgi:NAD(P)-dependent dehydrogenase (short-subunit alcohol dehydrogenase family)
VGGDVDQVVQTAIELGVNTLAEFDIEAATRAVTVKLVGYTEVVRVLRSRPTPDAAVVLFGELAKDRPYPSSTIVSAFNGGIATLVRTLAIELAPHRVNALHPGVVGDSPRWRDVPGHPHVQRTPIGRLVTMGGDRRRNRLPPPQHGDQRPEPARRRRCTHHLRDERP